MKNLFPSLILLASAGSIIAAPVDFVRDVRPIFEKHCYKCHGSEKQKGGLRLDVKSAALKGGDEHAPAIKPGNGADSPLIRFVAGLDPDLKMPPKGDPLSAEQIGLMRAWIDQGANWPDSASAKLEDPAKTHWSFQPLVRPAVSSVHAPVRNPIDSFIAEKLAANGLQPSPEADRRTLIRRLYFVLHGLPPAPEEVEAFVKDSDPRAYERLVDRLLDSPRYGERWARHWLDAVAFGETHGFEVNTPRQNAWPYRDYVIRAFNSDKPWPEFIRDQLAGDATGEDAATGFIVAKAALLGGQIGKDEESKALARQDELADMVMNAGSAFLGLTVGCARCHDHKFDPITQRDFYAMTAVFAGVRHGERTMRSADIDAREKEAGAIKAQIAAVSRRLVTWERRLLDLEPLASLGAENQPVRAAVHPQGNVDRFAPVQAERLRFTVLATMANNQRAPCLDELEVFTAGPDSRNVALASAGAEVHASGSLAARPHALSKVNDGLYGNEQSWISEAAGKGWVEVKFAKPERIDAVKWSRDRNGKYLDRLAVRYRIEVAAREDDWRVVATSDDRAPYRDDTDAPVTATPTGLGATELEAYRSARAELEALLKKLKTLGEPPSVYAGKFTEPDPAFRLHRGDPMQKREPVEPGAVGALNLAFDSSPDAPEQVRRLALARWIADPKNPLTARVLVNRLWQQHFGEGLVSTPSDFGRNGAKPANQALLDWLASEFIARGWSVKTMQRLIVNSATFRQSSAPNKQSQGVDAGTRLLWRFPPRRLEAEAIHDTMLAVCGTLDLRMGGVGYSVFAPNTNYVRVYDPKPAYGPAEWRRMIYMTKVRVAQDSTFGAFDCPDAGQNQPKRPRSTTPLQALNLFNSDFVHQQAGFFAERLEREAGVEPARQIQRAWRLAFQRAPDAGELRIAEELRRTSGLATLCRVVLNANEFLFLE